MSSTCTKLICAENRCQKVFWLGSSYKRHLQQSHMERNDEESVEPIVEQPEGQIVRGHHDNEQQEAAELEE